MSPIEAGENAPPARLAVERLRLGAFRSYAAAGIETGGATVALFGPNGSGKTNLLEAVSLLVPGRGLRRAAVEDMARAPARMGWRVRAEVATPSGPVEIVTGAEGPELARRTVEIDGETVPQTRLGEILRMVWLTPAMDRLWTEGAGDRRRFLDRMTMGFEPGHAQAATDYEKAMRGRNRLLKEGGDPAWLGGLEAQMARLGARIARWRAEALVRLVAAQEAADTAFPAAELAIDGSLERRFAGALRTGDELDAVEAEEAAGLSRTLAEARPRDAAAGRTLDGPHRSDLEAVYAAKAMPARACSTGEQKALLISLCLSNARALAAFTGAAPLLLLDEVAAHLDADRRAALYVEIARLGAQAWMTGTGAELFETLDPAALRVAVSEGPEGTRLAPA